MSTSSESMMSSDLAPPPPNVLVFTDAAAGKVSELIKEEANPNLKLRVFVSGGGCSGFQYGFTFDEKIEDGRFLHRECRCAVVGRSHECTVFDGR